MNNYKTKYEGSIVALIKALNVNTLSEFYDIELELGEDIHYQQIDYNEQGHKNKNKKQSPLGALIIKVGNVNTCKFAFSEAASCAYNDLLQDMYMALFERDPLLVKEVLEYVINKHSPEELMPVNYNRKKQIKEDESTELDKVECFRLGDDIMWNNQALTPMLENFKLLSDYLSADKKIFQLDNLLHTLKSNTDYEDFEEFKTEIVDFLLKHNYTLDYGVASNFICMCHNEEKMTELFNHLEKNSPEFKEDLMLYLTHQFLNKENQSSELSSINYAAKEHGEVSFLDNPQFAKLILEKAIFPEELNTSLESLVKAHFSFVAGNKQSFDENLLMNVKPGENILAYLEFLDYDEKKLFLKALANNTQVHDCINTEYCDLVEELIFSQRGKIKHNYLGIAYHLANNYGLEEKKEKLKEVIHTLISLPFNFAEKISSTIESSKLSNLNEAKQKEYFELMISQNDKPLSKIKI